MGLGGIEFYRVLSSFTEFYRVLQGFQKGSPNKVPSFTVWLLEKKMKRKLGGIEFYRVLPSFTEFYRVFKKVRQIRFRVLPFGCWEKRNEKKTWTERKKPPTARKAPLAPFDCTEFSGVF